MCPSSRHPLRDRVQETARRTRSLHTPHIVLPWKHEGGGPLFAGTPKRKIQYQIEPLARVRNTRALGRGWHSERRRRRRRRRAQVGGEEEQELANTLANSNAIKQASKG